MWLGIEKKNDSTPSKLARFGENVQKLKFIETENVIYNKPEGGKELAKT